MVHKLFNFRELARLNSLQERCEAFLEEDRILQTFDRIESRAAILTAKSERLKLLRVSFVFLVTTLLILAGLVSSRGTEIMVRK